VIDKRTRIRCERLNAYFLVFSARICEHGTGHHEYADNGDLVFQRLSLSFHNGRLHLDASRTSDAQR
jgi:hypothetical protein